MQHAYCTCCGCKLTVHEFLINQRLKICTKITLQHNSAINWSTYCTISVQVRRVFYFSSGYTFFLNLRNVKSKFVKFLIFLRPNQIFLNCHWSLYLWNFYFEPTSTAKLTIRKTLFDSSWISYSMLEEKHCILERKQSIMKEDVKTLTATL